MLQLGGAAPLQFPVDGGNSDQEPASPRSSEGLAYAGSATGCFYWEPEQLGVVADMGGPKV